MWEALQRSCGMPLAELLEPFGREACTPLCIQNSLWLREVEYVHAVSLALVSPCVVKIARANIFSVVESLAKDGIMREKKKGRPEI